MVCIRKLYEVFDINSTVRSRFHLLFISENANIEKILKFFIMVTKNNWVRQPQEWKGDYFFNGTLYITTNLAREVSQEEIISIVTDLKAFVQNVQGIDYLVVYIRPDGRKVFCIIYWCKYATFRLLTYYCMWHQLLLVCFCF